MAKPEILLTPAAAPPVRDLRLDLFRGLALVCIFIDHIPGNVLSGYTVQQLGYSDASEMFVFISGLTAGIVYGSTAEREGLAAARLRIWRRLGQIYAAHVLLVLLFCSAAVFASSRLENPSYVQGLNVDTFLRAPGQAVVETLTLRFQPPFMNILPLYVVLLACFPLMLRLIRVNRWLALGVSMAVYVLAREFGLSLRDFPRGEPWAFNPLAWQLVFVIGGVLSAAPRGPGLPAWGRRMMVCLAAAYCVFAYFAVRPLIWEPDLGGVPQAVTALILPVMDRTNLSLWRLAHLLALAWLVSRLLPADHPALRWRVLRPLVLCGQHSLPIFCLGVLLSFAGWVTLTELGNTWLVQCLVNAIGLTVMTGVAYLLTRSADGRRALRNRAHFSSPAASA